MGGMTTRVTFTFADGHTEDIETEEDAPGVFTFTAPEGTVSFEFRSAQDVTGEPAILRPGSVVEVRTLAD